MVGAALTYVDLSIFHALEGLAYAFPRAMSDAPRRFPSLYAIAGRVRELPRITAYHRSPSARPSTRPGSSAAIRELDGPAGW